MEGMSRTNPLHAARALWRAARAYVRALSLLRELEPDAVMGGGGYVAGPVGLAAVTLRIPLVLTEADSHLGLTNRVLARGARRVCLAFPLGRARGRALPRDGAADAAGADRSRGRAGATGAGGRSRLRARVRGLARRALDQHGRDRGVCGGAGPRPSIVLHVAGRRDSSAGCPRWSISGRSRRRAMTCASTSSLEQFGDALAVADLVVARAGGSVFEIAASGTPAILVPYPHASADHQAANARWMADAGAAIVIPDRELDAPRLAREVTGLLADRERLAAMASASRGLARPHAAGDIAKELLEAARA